ncbi:MAG TPA: putative molybdenum carrier protein [Alphaproteobacteria bacterium]|jgi:predicted Rossmann fold nucleotide-binding protein DprA/Smf involved in DNA uptake
MTGWRLRKIVSGGQAGVDRAALDVALARRIPCGGWCPKGRLAEGGVIPDRYPLMETATADVAERTRLNVRDSDVTLVMVNGASDKGTDHTLAVAAELGRPALRIDLVLKPDPQAVNNWLGSVGASLVLNIAGPRESNAPGIQALAREYLRWLLADVALDDDLHELPGL